MDSSSDRLKVQICQNHLPMLYEALKANNIKDTEKIEHVLTEEEQCVACAYILKIKDSASVALERYLIDQGFKLQPSKTHPISKMFIFRLFELFLAMIGIVAIIFINYQIIGSWFGKNGPANIGSIEVSYVSMGRFIADFGPPVGGSTWMPLWYLGFPFDVFYTPLLPAAEALLHQYLNLQFWSSYRALTGLAYILGPVSLFFLGWQLSKKAIGGILAGLIYSVGPTIFYFLVPGVAGDRISADFWDPRRFTILVRWGEGPHLFSLIFVPLVGVFYNRFLEQGKFRDLSLSAVFLGLTALCNAIGFSAALILIFAMSFVKFSQDKYKPWMALINGVKVLAISLGLISFWYNLSFISSFFKEGGGTTNLLLSLFPWGWVLILFGIIVLYFIFAKFIRDFSLALSLFLFLIFFAVVGVYYYTEALDHYSAIEILPQALRYNVEVDLSLSLLLSIVIVKIAIFLGNKARVLGFLMFGVELLICLSLLAYIQPFIPTAIKSASNVVILTNTREYAVSSWFFSHVDQKSGERVFVPGNYGFYLNFFNNVWQSRGALFQASTHHWPEHIYYQLANGIDPEIAKAWFVAMNTKFALIPTPGSAELYKDIKNLNRFSSLAVENSEQGDIIYKIPLTRESPAKPVNLLAMKNLKVPAKADDKKPLLAYANWVQNSSKNIAEFLSLDNDHYTIKGKLSDGEAILVQMTSDLGWSAYDKTNKTSVKLGHDPLGFLIIYPKPGEVNISLTHGNSWVQWLGYILSIITLGVLIWFDFFKRIFQK